MDEKNVVVIKSFGSVQEAQVYKALLESAGIPARMQHDIAAQVLPVYGAYLNVNLLVSGDDQAKAREVLSAKFDAEEVKSGTMASKREETLAKD